MARVFLHLVSYFGDDPSTARRVFEETRAHGRLECVKTLRQRKFHKGLWQPWCKLMVGKYDKLGELWTCCGKEKKT